MGKRPTQILEEEHKYIQVVVSALAVLAEKIEAGVQIKKEILEAIVDFMRSYADKDHHGKEEEILFPFLEKKGVPSQGCPISILITEHAKGRMLVGALADGAEAYTKGDAGAKESLLKALHGLTDLYPKHIWREDYLLFPMTDKLLSAEDQEYLSRLFNEAEDAFGADKNAIFEQAARDIKEGLAG